MKYSNKISGLAQLGIFLKNFISKKENEYDEAEMELSLLIKKSELQNPWFTKESINAVLSYWGNQLTQTNIEKWIGRYKISLNPKKIGLILAGNIPLVGFHDIICVVLSGNIPLIKMSSKDKILIPFFLYYWNNKTQKSLTFEFVEILKDYDAIIGTGSNNTARYLEYYFKNTPNIIRKNRTSIAVLDGNETDEELKLLSKDIFLYFGLGCRNVTKLFIPHDFKIDRLFENFIDFKNTINHHKYANNYDYNRAIYLLNQETFWDNNFVMLKEDTQLFSPISVVNFSRYGNIKEVEFFVSNHQDEIQCIVGNIKSLNSTAFGEAQNPPLDTYADNIDTLSFLELI